MTIATDNWLKRKKGELEPLPICSVCRETKLTKQSTKDRQICSACYSVLTVADRVRKHREKKKLS